MGQFQKRFSYGVDFMLKSATVAPCSRNHDAVRLIPGMPSRSGVHIRDLHATILHLLGKDHRRLTYKFQGLDMRLSGVEDAHVVNGVLSNYRE